MEEEKKVVAANQVAENKVASEVPTEAQDVTVVRAPRPENGERRPREDRRVNFRENRNRRRNNDRHEQSEFEERVVAINRVSKTVKGGRRMRFTALVVVGDGKGRYGYATGKASEVPDAIKKALEAARKNIHHLDINKNGTFSHEIIGKFGACSVFLKPARDGTGIIAGGPVRAILELAGVKNVLSKVYGSRAPINIIKATTNGLDSLKTYKSVVDQRK